MHFFASSCLAGMWYMMRQCCPPKQCSQPPQSFYRKLIGSCHWCVKLLCAGHRRQLDYSVSVFSILVQVPSALLSSSNDAVVFKRGCKWKFQTINSSRSSFSHCVESKMSGYCYTQSTACGLKTKRRALIPSLRSSSLMGFCVLSLLNVKLVLFQRVFER